MSEPAKTAARVTELARLHRTIPVRRYRSLVAHWLAGWFTRPAPAVRDERVVLSAGQVAVTFGGHATSLVRYPQLTVVIDPMLGSWIGAARRAVEPGLGDDDLAEVGLILISHRHADHLHLPTLARLPRSATIVVPAGAASWVSKLGFARTVELAPGADLELRGVQVIATPMSHGDGELAAGLAYVIRGDGPSVFACGDSAYFSGFADIGARYAPDVSLLPIGGFVPGSFRRRHMSPLDALYAFEDLRSRLLVPIHHGAFALSYEKLGEPIRWLTELATARGLREHLLVMAPGQTERFVAPTHEVWVDVASAPIEATAREQ